MRTLYLDCQMGAAGDMIMAALLELHPDPARFMQKLNGLNIPGVSIKAVPAVKCGITGTQVTVTINDEVEESLDAGHQHAGHQHAGHKHHADHHHDGHHHDHAGHHHDDQDDRRDGHHHHAGMQEIGGILGNLAVSDKVRHDALAVYNLIAEAESHVHGKPTEQIHFHEVGMMDAVADIVGVCMLMEELAPDRVLASPVHVGCGRVRCAHGLLPVPAPATLYLLRNIPIYGGSIRGELCTPTGAALLRYFVSCFGDMPVLQVTGIGYGMGRKDFEAANCVRALLGEDGEKGDQVAELSCNLDDMTPEALGFALERLLEAGALDVYTTAIGMKKNRPGTMLSCLCSREKSREMAALIFAHTTTLGIREKICSRYKLQRTEKTVQTPYGPVRIKEAAGWGVERRKPAYDDVARIAREEGCSLAEVLDKIKP